MKLSIVIPAYNEEKRLRPMLDVYTGFFVPHYGSDVEFVVVVNGSTDRTEDVAREYAVNCPGMRVLVDPEKIGKGGAIMRGFAEASGALIGFVDADTSTPPEAFQDLVDHIGDAGAIIASRWLKESKVSPRQPASRLITSRIFNALIRLLFNLNIMDTQCGAKLMTEQAVAAIMPHIGVTRWAFDVDLLFQLRRHGFRIVEWPTIWQDAEGSQLHVFTDSAEMFLAIIRLRLLYSPFRWVITVYDKTLGRIIHLRQ
jgi:glycosyltransferase involved in cell wall biosynthesis